MKPLNLIIGLLAFSLVLPMSWSKDAKVTGKALDRERLISNIIKNTLEAYHYRRMKIDDSVSQKAFTEFLKKMDYGKQFFLKSDIAELEKFQFKLDDELLSGELELLNKAVTIMEQRVKQADKVRNELFKKEFNFKEDESMELDPEKRDWASSEEDFKNNWRKIFKQATLNRYLALSEGLGDEEDVKKKEDKKEKKKEQKKMTDKEMRQKSHKAISEKYDKFFKRLLKEDRYDHLEKYFNAVAAVYDPHTNYLPPKRKEDFDIDISGKLEGIGAVLQEDGPYIKVVKIVPGGAAWRQRELEVDDIILMVSEKKGEPVDLVDMRVDDAVRYIRGKKGTEVRLTVKKPDGTRRVIPIVRDEVQIDASYAKSSVLQLKGQDLKVGYIMLPKFYRDFDADGGDARSCTEDVRQELARLKAQKVDGVILDLRNNGGGALEDARQMSGLFIEEGPIVQIKNMVEQVEVMRDTDKSVFYDGPLIVLTNRFSASASEILAGAMKDYNRAVIVGGEYSHGKGTVQAVLPLNNGPLRTLFSKEEIGSMKITIQKFYRINGLSTQYKGVTPDIVLPDPYAYSKSREQDLDYSLPWDTVSKLDYNTWKKFSYDIDLLKKRSEARVKSDDRFSKIQKSVDYLTKKRDETVISLNMDTLVAEEKKNKKVTEELKNEEETKELIVSNFEESLKSHENIRPGDEDKWKKDFEQRKDEWVRDLRRDPTIIETYHIMSDIIKKIKGQTLSMVP